MPRGKAGLKSPTKADAKENLQQSSTVEMKDIESTASVDIRGEEGTCELSTQSELPNNISDMSVDANTTSNEGDGSSLPRKPKRLLTFAGSKKKDAKRRQRQSGDKAESSQSTDNNKQASPRVETPQKQQSIKAERDNTSPKKKKNICQSYKRQFFDDGHAYEDPSLLVNNSTTPHMTEQNYLENPTEAIKKQSKMEERPQSPSSVKTGLSKSTESIKAAVKGLKEGHASIMSETSIPRSIFAALVALLLSLIVFLAVYFLLHCHAVLSVAVAILVYVVIFINLGFMDGKRMKCLILLLLPSVCSRGGRLALYLLLGYFVITGPLCNMIGNIKTVKNSMKCMNINERPEVVRGIIKTFEAAQNCMNSKQVLSTKANKSMEIKCLEQRIEQRCLSVKDKFQHRCGLKDHKIAPTLCNLSADLSCMNETTILRNLQDCPKKLSERYCHSEFHEILEFLDEITSDDDGCGFLEIFSMLFPLLIIFVLYEGYNYENNYRTYNDFHNFFLTGHFQIIDQSRSSCDRDAVLPLRKVELRKHVRPATVFNLTDIEKKELWSNLKTYLLALLIVLFLILADLYMFRMFDMKNNGKLQSDSDVVLTNITTITNISEHFVDMNKTIQNNNETQLSNITGFKVNTTSAPEINPNPPVETTNICSASVDPPGSISKIILPIILSLLLLVIIFQAHVSRLQWCICSRLYTMREKERVFYLYNKILEDRVQLLEDCRKRMKCYRRETKTLNSLKITRILAQQLPWLSKIFKIFHFNLRRCIICNDSEKPEFKLCHGLDCSCVYCLTCSFDIDKKCLYCDTELKHSLSLKLPDGKVVSSKESLV
jgi:hypothetical protein